MDDAPNPPKRENRLILSFFEVSPSGVQKDFGLLKQIPEAEAMPRYDHNKITVLEQPEEPATEDYTFENDDDEEEFDKKGFNAALQEYKHELKQYEKDVKDEKNQKALLEKSGDFYLVYFNLDAHRNVVTAIIAKQLR